MAAEILRLTQTKWPSCILPAQYVQNGSRNSQHNPNKMAVFQLTTVTASTRAKA